jgi:hypothetical protein
VFYKQNDKSYVINSDCEEGVRNRLGNYNSIDTIKEIRINYNQNSSRKVSNESFRRIFLLIFAVTVHNIPGKILLKPNK